MVSTDARATQKSILTEELRTESYFNPFLFIRGLSCPSCIQASLSLNCLKLTTPGIPYNCLSVSCGDIGFFEKILGLEMAWKSGLQVLFLPLGRSCPL